MKKYLYMLLYFIFLGLVVLITQINNLVELKNIIMIIAIVVISTLIFIDSIYLRIYKSDIIYAKSLDELIDIKNRNTCNAEDKEVNKMEEERTYETSELKDIVPKEDYEAIVKVFEEK